MADHALQRASPLGTEGNLPRKLSLRCKRSWLGGTFVSDDEPLFFSEGLNLQRINQHSCLLERYDGTLLTPVTYCAIGRPRCVSRAEADADTDATRCASDPKGHARTLKTRNRHPLDSSRRRVLLPFAPCLCEPTNYCNAATSDLRKVHLRRMMRLLPAGTPKYHASRPSPTRHDQRSSSIALTAVALA
jgi:hypothetical protein